MPLKCSPAAHLQSPQVHSLQTLPCSTWSLCRNPRNLNHVANPTYVWVCKACDKPNWKKINISPTWPWCQIKWRLPYLSAGLWEWKMAHRFLRWLEPQHSWPPSRSCWRKPGWALVEDWVQGQRCHQKFLRTQTSHHHLNDWSTEVKLCPSDTYTVAQKWVTGTYLSMCQQVGCEVNTDVESLTFSWSAWIRGPLHAKCRT